MSETIAVTISLGITFSLVADARTVRRRVSRNGGERERVGTVSQISRGKFRVRNSGAKLGYLDLGQVPVPH